ncbi:LuxR C-terminal-related transcriptional regulator [Phaeobacter sp.]|uniref:helix-turn-helix domain-containing protein n=1 Tax=Phaeobacter sp. TaxID=1902409 RepID=UPI0025F38908|nr:LuxR C-terminal-related transcriptional regulator [Phaeobacter sp.]
MEDTGEVTVTLLNTLPAVVDAIGTLAFEKRLADMLGAVVEHDFTTMARYSTQNAPAFLIHSHSFPAHLAELYLETFVSADPYVRYWCATQCPGVVWLQEVAADGKHCTQYRDVFLPQIGVSDELGVFLPPLGTDAIAVFLNRRRGVFSHREVDQLREVYPVAAALYRQHIRAMILSGEVSGSPSFGRPMRATSRTGQTIWLTSEWQDQQGETQPQLCTAIAEAFGVTDRYIWTPASQQRDVSGLQADTFDIWADQIRLTPRERDIVRLVLQGESSQRIAETLQRSPGTIKNHKRRIYSKLDITCERELILMYVAAVSRPR